MKDPEIRPERFAGSNAMPHLGTVMRLYNDCMEPFLVSFISAAAFVCLSLVLNVCSTRIKVPVCVLFESIVNTTVPLTLSSLLLKSFLFYFYFFPTIIVYTGLFLR